MTRRILPQRRYSETFMLPFGGLKGRATSSPSASTSRATSAKDLLINGGSAGRKSGRGDKRDGAVLLSLALQYGC